MFLIQMIQVKIVLRIPHGRLQMEDFTQILLVEEGPIMTNPSPHPLPLLMNPFPHPLPLLLINNFELNYPPTPPTFDEPLPPPPPLIVN